MKGRTRAHDPPTSLLFLPGECPGVCIQRARNKEGRRGDDDDDDDDDDVEEIEEEAEDGGRIVLC